MKRLLFSVSFCAVFIILSVAGYLVYSRVYSGPGTTGTQNVTGQTVTWRFDQAAGDWIFTGTPPACPEPFIFPAPADVRFATSILYPGQVRGGDYKPHGGFRFDAPGTNDIEVRAPFDGNLFMAARHTEAGEIQYVLYVINDCGMMYKLDHLLELTPAYMRVLETIPLRGDGDSRSTFLQVPVFIPAGEPVATKVGLSGNMFFDFGVYDLRKKNNVDYSKTNYHNIEEYGEHAVCWLEYLAEPERSRIQALPGADGVTGTTSDYCSK